MRLDSIGDFILWLEAARELKEIYPPQTHEISLLASREWAQMAKQFDYWDHVIEVDRKLFTTNFVYRWQILKNIRNSSYDIVLHPVFSRIFNLGDSVVRLSLAKIRIGWDLYHDLNAPFLFSLKKLLTKPWYTQLIPLDRSRPMELEKNAQFLYALGAKGFLPSIPYIRPFLDYKKRLIDGNYVVIAPDAQWHGREWPIEHYINIARKLMDTYPDLKLVFLGTSHLNALKISTALTNNPRIINLIKKTSLMDYVSVISFAQLVIANESSAIHIAAASRVMSVAIVGGGHWGRFLPYNTQQPTDYHPHIVNSCMDCYHCEWHCKFKRRPKDPVKCIAVISEETVWQRIQELLKNTLSGENPT